MTYLPTLGSYLSELFLTAHCLSFLKYLNLSKWLGFPLLIIFIYTLHVFVRNAHTSQIFALQYSNTKDPLPPDFLIPHFYTNIHSEVSAEQGLVLLLTIN